jgi:hypothetical protein
MISVSKARQVTLKRWGRVETERLKLERFVALAVSLTVALTVGCATTGPQGEIPFGEWSGHGKFVYETWESDKDPKSIHGDYSTRLSVRPRTVDGRDYVELEIVSGRGSLPELGEKTHLKVALSEGKRVSESAVLYRSAGWLFNPEPGETLDFKDEAAPYCASCMTIDGTTVLQIRYFGNFVDTFRFRGQHLAKAGILFEDYGLIHWSEQLTRQD